jgi:hypothetical protein
MAIVNIDGVSAGALNLKNLMDGVLEKTVEVFEDYNVPLPSRQFWTVGEPAIDCEQLVVSFIQTYLGLPGNQASEPQRCQTVRSAVLTISISREIPVVGVNGKAPTGDKIEEASRIAVVDAWMFMELINKLDQWEPGEFGLGVIATADSSGFDGGFQTTAMQLTMVVP